MSADEIEKFHHRYEARLGATMTKTLGNSFISLFVGCVFKYFSVSDLSKLLDMGEFPIMSHALTDICCEMYLSLMQC